MCTGKTSSVWFGLTGKRWPFDGIFFDNVQIAQSFNKLWHQYLLKIHSTSCRETCNDGQHPLNTSRINKSNIKSCWFRCKVFIVISFSYRRPLEAIISSQKRLAENGAVYTFTDSISNIYHLLEWNTFFACSFSIILLFIVWITRKKKKQNLVLNIERY